MEALSAAFPELVAELSVGLRDAELPELVQQLNSAQVERVSYDPEVSAGYIRLIGRPLNVVETNLIGVRHGSTFEVESSFRALIDLDNFGRIVGIEVLEPGSVREELQRRAAV